MKEPATIPEVKVVIVGESAVGKSSLTLKFVNNQYRENSIATIGAAYLSKSITVNSAANKKDTVKFNIWDTAGQEKYRSLASLYYRGADCAIVVYDITNKASYDEVQNYWMQELKHQCHGNAGGLRICIVGNKSDLADKREVAEALGRQLAEDYGAHFFETSAKCDDNIILVFKQFATDMIELDGKRSESTGGWGSHAAIRLTVPERKKSACC